MKLPWSRLYSIQAKLGIILLIAVIVILCGGAGSLFLSNRFLLISQLFVKGALPKIQVATALQQTTFRLSGFTREISLGKMPEHLQDRYGELAASLDQVEALTAIISQEESSADILTFNYLSQAIRNQAGVVFQVEVHIARKSEQLNRTLADIRNDLIAVSNRVVQREANGEEKILAANPPGPLQDMIAVVDKLTLDTWPAELQRLHELFALSTQRIATFNLATLDARHNETFASELDGIATLVEQIFAVKSQ